MNNLNKFLIKQAKLSVNNPDKISIIFKPCKICNNLVDEFELTDDKICNKCFLQELKNKYKS